MAARGDGLAMDNGIALSALRCLTFIDLPPPASDALTFVKLESRQVAQPQTQPHNACSQATAPEAAQFQLHIKWRLATLSRILREEPQTWLASLLSPSCATVRGYLRILFE